jgi:hypothetical protein
LGEAQGVSERRILFLCYMYPAKTAAIGGSVAATAFGFCFSRTLHGTATLSAAVIDPMVIIMRCAIKNIAIISVRYTGGVIVFICRTYFDHDDHQYQKGE